MFKNAIKLCIIQLLKRANTEFRLNVDELLYTYLDWINLMKIRKGTRTHSHI